MVNEGSENFKMMPRTSPLPSLEPPCTQARMVRAAREHEVIMARNLMSNHTDMQDKYCGHSNDIKPIQSQYKGNHRRGAAANGRHLCMLALNRVNVVAVTTMRVLHVGVIGRHVPCHYDFMLPRRSYNECLHARVQGPGGLARVFGQCQAPQ